MQHDDLAERLTAFATAALSPDEEAMARLRAVLVERAAASVAVAAPLHPRPAVPVLGSAWLALATTASRMSDRLRAAAARSSRTLLLVQRGAFAAGILALVLSFGTGLAAAAAPGAPLYGARLWLETVNLPASGPARASSEVGLLESRLNEARDAAAHNDGRALKAALDAYEETANDAAKNVDPDDHGRLDDVLTKHVVVLQSLLGKTGGESKAALEAAIDRSKATIDRIEGRRESTPGGNAGGSDGNTGGSGATGGSGNTGGSGTTGGNTGSGGNGGNTGTGGNGGAVASPPADPSHPAADPSHPAPGKPSEHPTPHAKTDHP